MRKKTAARGILFLETLVLLVSLLSACGRGVVIEAPEDLAQLRIGTVYGTAGDRRAAGLDCAGRTTYIDTDSAAAALLTGEADCLILDYDLARAVVSHYDGISTTEDRILEDEAFCAAVRAEDADTRAVAEVVVAEVSHSNDFLKLCRGFTENLGAERDAFITGPRVGSGGTLTVGLVPDLPPYAYLTSAGAPAGIAVELAKAFAAKRDQTLAVRTFADEPRMLRALTDGEIDLCFVRMPVTPTVSSAAIAGTSVCYTSSLRVLIRTGK